MAAAPADPEGPNSPPPQLPDGWLAQWEGKEQKYYFVQRATGLSQWDVPTQPAPSVPTPTATPQNSSTYPAPNDARPGSVPNDGSRGIGQYEGSERSFFSNKYSGMPNQQMSTPGQYNQNTLQGQYGQNPAYQSGMGNSSLGNLAQGLLGRVANTILPPKQGAQGQQQSQQQGQYGQTYQQGMGQHQSLLPSLTHGLFSHQGQQQNQQNFGYSGTGQTTSYTGTAPPATYQVPGQQSAQPGQPMSQFNPTPGTIPGQLPGQTPNQFGQPAQQFGVDSHGGLSSQFSSTPQLGQAAQPASNIYGTQSQQGGQPTSAYGMGLGAQTPSYTATPPQPQWQQQTPGIANTTQPQSQPAYGQTQSFPPPPQQPPPGQFSQNTPSFNQQTPQYTGQTQTQYGQQTSGVPTPPAPQTQQVQSPPATQFGQSGLPQQSQQFSPPPPNPYAPGPGQPPYAQTAGQGFASIPSQQGQQSGQYGQQPQYQQISPAIQAGRQDTPSYTYGQASQTPQFQQPGQQSSAQTLGMTQAQSPFQQNQQQPGSQFQPNPNQAYTQQRPGMTSQNPSQQSMNVSSTSPQQFNQQWPGMTTQPGSGMQTPGTGLPGNISPQGGYPGR